MTKSSSCSRKKALNLSTSASSSRRKAASAALRRGGGDDGTSRTSLLRRLYARNLSLHSGRLASTCFFSLSPNFISS